MANDYLVDRQRRFQEKYQRPLPWYEAVEPSELSNLMWTLSERLRIPRTSSLGVVTTEAFKRVKWLEGKSTRDARAGLAWLGIAPEGTVLLSGDGGDWVIRLLLKDAVDYWEVLVPTDAASFLISESGEWMVVMHHEGMMGGFIFRASSSS